MMPYSCMWVGVLALGEVAALVGEGGPEGVVAAAAQHPLEVVPGGHSAPSFLLAAHLNISLLR